MVVVVTVVVMAVVAMVAGRHIHNYRCRGRRRVCAGWWSTDDADDALALSP